MYYIKTHHVLCIPCNLNIDHKTVLIDIKIPLHFNFSLNNN